MAVMMLAIIGFVTCVTASRSIQDIRYARRGSPPIEQLQLIAGSVVRWADCSRPSSKSSWRESVSLRGGAETTKVIIPCVLPAGSLSDGKPHGMEIRIRTRVGRPYVVYDVAWDGRTLLAYATVKQEEDDATSQMKFAAIVLTPLVALFIGLSWAALTIWRKSPRRRPES